MSVIFINYRRDDSAIAAFWLYERLSQYFGEDRVFLDLKIELGADFVSEIDNAIGACQVLIAVIGRDWVSILKERENSANDYVRLEIASALQKKAHIIPVLSPGASMPTPDLLPPDISAIAHRSALILNPTRLKEDMKLLISALELKLQKSPSESQNGKELNKTCLNISGQWIKDTKGTGTMFFMQRGCNVIGIYDLGGDSPLGVYKGRAVGNAFEFEWHWFDDNTMKGFAHLRLQDNGKVLIGFWSFEGDLSEAVPSHYKYINEKMPSWLSEKDFEPFLEYLMEE